MEGNIFSRDRRLAMLAALPVLLYGFGVAMITLFLIVIGGPDDIVNLFKNSFWHNLALMVGSIALIGLAAAAYIALKSSLPFWSYTWIGASLVGLLVVLNLVSEDRNHIVAPVFDTTVLIIFLLSALITFCTAALRGWQHSGLFTAGLNAALGMSLCFLGVAGPFETYLGGVAILIGIIEAYCIYSYIFLSNSARVFVLFMTGILNIGVAWMLESAFWAQNPQRSVSQFWHLAAIFGGFLLVGTLTGIPSKYISDRIALLSNYHQKEK